MVTWTPVPDSTRVGAIAYDPDTETIYVEFPTGVDWHDAKCPSFV